MSARAAGAGQPRIGARPPASLATAHRRVLVPYPLEAALSGVRLTPFSSDLPGDVPFDASNLDNGSTPCAFWYRRTFTAAPPAPGGRVYLRFEAVMSTAKVFLNGHLLGGHQGGYDDFSFEVSSLLKAGAEANVLEVGVVNDALFHGKQFVKKFWAPGGIAYSTSSGIWQSVWLERLASGPLRLPCNAIVVCCGPSRVAVCAGLSSHRYVY